MAQSRYSLPTASRAADVLNRQLQAVESDIQAGRLAEAAQSLNELVRAHPKEGSVYVAGWMLANKTGNLEAAYQSAARAVELAPRSGTAHFCLAETEHRRGELEAARASIEQAVTLAPGVLQFRELAVNIAHAQLDYAFAEKQQRAAFAINKSIPGIQTMIGHSLRLQGKFEPSATWLNDAIALDPDDANAHHELAMVAYALDDTALAQRHINEALRVRPQDDEFVYLQAVLSGNTPAHPPESVVGNLFDRSASHYDAQQVGKLNYLLPSLIAQKILAHFPDRNINLLDLGCGTGLLGAALGTINGYFVGVDLSLPMIDEAKKHNLYSRFHHVNLLDALDATDGNEFEVIVAADVFTYVGELDAAIGNAFKVLKAGGWLYFSCESAPDNGADYVLGKSMRYAHSTRYVTRLLKAAGFARPTIDAIDLRTDETTLIPGYLVSVQKPA